MNFPQYRRLVNGKSYYKISDPSTMTEIQQIGKKWHKHVMLAKILPERNLISDLLSNHDGHYETITSEEFTVKESLLNS